MRPSGGRIEGISVEPFELDLRVPFGIATGAQGVGGGLLVTVRLEGGAVGIGEAAPFPAYNGETLAETRAALAGAEQRLAGRNAGSLRPIAAELLASGWPAAARCAVETALLDAWLRMHGMPMNAYFGGASTQLETDVTVTTGTPEEARAAAMQLARAGYRAVKVKVGGAARRNLKADVARVVAVVRAFEGIGAQARIQLDANASLEGREAVELMRELSSLGIVITLFEQPVAPGDLDGMRLVRESAGVRVAADEAAVSAHDVVQLASARAADVVNLKLMKSGIIESLDMASAARALGFGLMIGGLVESEITMTTSACFAAGLGGFEFADLDTPLFLAQSPCEGGLRYAPPCVSVDHVAAGHGVRVNGVEG